MKSLLLILILNLGILQAESDVYEFKKKSLEHSFKIGYEYRTVENTFNKGSVRLDLSSYFIPGKIDFLHIDTRFTLINKDEKANFNTSISSKGDRQSLSMYISLIHPCTMLYNINFLETKHDGFLGFMVEYGLTKYATDDENFGVSGRQEYYVGLRLAVNRDIYADILWGKAETLGKKTVKFRAETIIKKSSWSLGGEYLLAVEDRKNTEDFMKIYISKSFTFDGLI